VQIGTGQYKNSKVELLKWVLLNSRASFNSRCVKMIVLQISVDHPGSQIAGTKSTVSHSQSAQRIKLTRQWCAQVLAAGEDQTMMLRNKLSTNTGMTNGDHSKQKFSNAC
jgi:hypothetical protein